MNQEEDRRTTGAKAKHFHKRLRLS